MKKNKAPTVRQELRKTPDLDLTGNNYYIIYPRQNQDFTTALENYIQKYHEALIPIAKGTKKPCHKGTWKRIFEPDEFSDCNIAIKAGAKFGDGYILIIDFDDSDEETFNRFLERLSEYNINKNTTIVKTGGKHQGFHVYFLTSEPLPFTRVTIKFAHAEIEIRARDCYALIPPSRVKTEYRVIQPQGSYFVLPENLQFITPEQVFRLLDDHPSPTTTLKVFFERRDKKNNISRRESLSVVVLKREENLRKKSFSGKSSEKRIVLREIKELYRFEVVKKIIRRLCEEIHKQPCDVKIRKNLLSPIRPEKHPSFQLVVEENGEVQGVDFGISQKAMRIQEIYHAYKTGEVRTLSKRSELARWTLEIVRDFNIWTEKAVKYDEKVSKFMEHVKGKVPESFYRVFEVILQKMVELARVESEDILTARKLQELTGVDYKITNKALNILATCGLLEKTKAKELRSGTTSLLKPCVNFDPGEAIKIFDRLNEYLKSRGGFYKFSRKAVVQVGLTGVYKIFRRGGNDGKRAFDEELEDNDIDGEVFYNTRSMGDRRINLATARCESDLQRACTGESDNEGGY